MAWKKLPWTFKWFSEIAKFPSEVLALKYPDVPNVGDMNSIPEQLCRELIDAPDLFCGGPPCQAFSLAGWKNGLHDERGNLTLKFVEIAEANDFCRSRKGLARGLVLWENVEGVLADKTNAFGCLVSSLAGLPEALEREKWPAAGIVRGVKRNVAWRVLDAKYFGLPQQRRRLYLLASDPGFFPENVLFEKQSNVFRGYPETALVFEKDGHTFEVFREYTDCLYSSYGTKWNGNAAAYNGSLFVLQDERIRRLSPLECERLMGFPDNYTAIASAKNTNRYQALGNSWAVPVISWIGQRIHAYRRDVYDIRPQDNLFQGQGQSPENAVFIDLGKDTFRVSDDLTINCGVMPAEVKIGSMKQILAVNQDEAIYLSPVASLGMIRRKLERNLNMNSRLEEVLLQRSAQMPKHEIDKQSKRQKRGRMSNNKKIENEVLALLHEQNRADKRVRNKQPLLF